MTTLSNPSNRAARDLHIRTLMAEELSELRRRAAEEAKSDIQAAELWFRDNPDFRTVTANIELVGGLSHFGNGETIADAIADCLRRIAESNLMNDIGDQADSE